jgi:hypothetical protein
MPLAFLTWYCVVKTTRCGNSWGPQSQLPPTCNFHISWLSFLWGHYVRAWIIKTVKWSIADLTIWLRFSAGRGIFLPPRPDQLRDPVSYQVSPGALSPVVNDSGRQADSTHLYRVMNMWSSTSNQPYFFSWRGVGHMDSFSSLCWYYTHRNFVREDRLSLHARYLPDT